MMTLEAKLAIPLIDDHFNKEDIVEEKGFIGAYLYDYERPQLNNHVFLLYKLDGMVDYEIQRMFKFREFSNYHSDKIMYVNGESHVLYAFKLVNYKHEFTTTITNIKKGIIPQGGEFAKILAFWNFTEPEINDLLRRQVKSFSPSKNIIVPLDDNSGYNYI